MNMQGHVQLNRIPPQAGPEAYKTYSWRAPLSTHWRPATCEEVDCPDFLNGFVTTVDTATDLGQKQYHFLTHDRKRSYSMQRVNDTLCKFVFRPGTICMRFRDHRAPIGRPPLFLVSGGDWRGNPRQIPTTRHRTAENWIEDFSDHQDRISTAVQRG
jgi:hypothetical protein